MDEAQKIYVALATQRALLQALYAAQSPAIRGAIRLDLLTQLQDNPVTSAALSGADPIEIRAKMQGNFVEFFDDVDNYIDVTKS